MRDLCSVAEDILGDWKKPYFGAVPYIEALAALNTIDDNYGCEDARSIVRYFLANASSWRGEGAKRIKAELKAML
jgi:hypothetical protein